MSNVPVLGKGHCEYLESSQEISKILEEAKSLKEEIKKNIDSLQELLIYEDIDELKDTLISTKPYIEAIITIINRLDDKLNNYKYGFLTEVHKLLHDDHINLIRISSKTHNVGIIMMKGNFGYL